MALTAPPRTLCGFILAACICVRYENDPAETFDPSQETLLFFLNAMFLMLVWQQFLSKMSLLLLQEEARLNTGDVVIG